MITKGIPSHEKSEMTLSISLLNMDMDDMLLGSQICNYIVLRELCHF